MTRRRRRPGSNPAPPPSEESLPELDALTPQHRAFVVAYVGQARFNASAAAQIAGYSATSRGSLRSTASTVLRRPDVQAALRALLEGLALTAEATLAALATEATDPEVPPPVRVRALELIGKHLGLWTEKMEIQGDLKLGSLEDALGHLVRQHYGPPPTPPSEE